MDNIIVLSITNAREVKVMDFHNHPNINHKFLNCIFKKKDGQVIKNKEVVRMILDKNEEMVLKLMKFDSKEVEKIRALYREYTVGNLLGSLTDGVAKSIYILEEVEGSETTVVIAYKDYLWSMRENL